MAPAASNHGFHLSLLMFFKLHVRLFLNSFGLLMSPRGTPSLSALSVCYSSAVDTLKLVGKDFAAMDMLVSVGFYYVCCRFL